MFQKYFADEIKLHVLCSVTFWIENYAIYVILWKNMAESDRLYLTIKYGAEKFDFHAGRQENRHTETLIAFHSNNG